MQEMFTLQKTFGQFHFSNPKDLAYMMNGLIMVEIKSETAKLVMSWYQGDLDKYKRHCK